MKETDLLEPTNLIEAGGFEAADRFSQPEGPMGTYHPAEAVADACMYAQASLLDRVLNNPEIYLPYGSEEDWMSVTQCFTRGWCLRASAQALDFLEKRYRVHFPVRVMIMAQHSSTTKFSSNLEEYKYHAYFLVRDSQGVWWAGSPANHSEDKDVSSPLTQVLSSPDLEEILKMITTVSGGDWPPAKEIESGLGRCIIGRGRDERGDYLVVSTFEQRDGQTFLGERYVRVEVTFR